MSDLAADARIHASVARREAIACNPRQIRLAVRGFQRACSPGVGRQGEAPVSRAKPDNPAKPDNSAKPNTWAKPGSRAPPCTRKRSQTF